MTNDLTQLHHFTVEHFRLDELRTLCFDVHIDYDDLGGQAKSGKARELILRMQREGDLGKLLSYLATARPKVFAKLVLHAQ